MGDEIASVLRTADEAAKRLRADAEEKASARMAEATEQAKAVADEAEAKAATRHDEAEKAAADRLAEAEAESQGLVDQAKGVLQEANGLLEEVRARDRRLRGEADARAEAQRVEQAKLVAQAGRDREQAAEVLTLSRTVLADTEQELARRIEQATASLATLTELQAALDLLEERHTQLGGAPTASGDEKPEESAGDEKPEESAGDEKPEESTGEPAPGADAVIDLTDSGEATAEHTDADAEAHPEPGSDDQLDGSLRDAVARVTQYLSKGQEPEA